MITAIIIDDEEHNRNVLKTLLKKYCPRINIIGEEDNADAAFLLINKSRPNLVFLDIKMQGKSGFDLLKMFSEINFEVIFVSGFNEFAIHAFEFNALDYILKPIDYTKLVKAVERAENKLKSNNNTEGILHFIKTLDDKNNLVNKFTVHQNGKVIFVNVTEILFIEGKGDFCLLHLNDNKHYTSSKDLKLFEDVLLQSGDFIRVNKSMIINTHFIKSYTKGDTCQIELTNGQIFEVSRRKKTEIIQKLKSMID